MKKKNVTALYKKYNIRVKVESIDFENDEVHVLITPADKEMLINFNEKGVVDYVKSFWEDTKEDCYCYWPNYDDFDKAINGIGVQLKFKDVDDLRMAGLCVEGDRGDD